MKKAIFLDFYGTVVFEDGENIEKISKIIQDTGGVNEEFFEYALNATGLKPEQVVHIGDSLSSDVKGASALGIDTIWLNRRNREVPKGVCSVGNLLEVFKTRFFK